MLKITFQKVSRIMCDPWCLSITYGHPQRDSPSKKTNLSTTLISANPAAVLIVAWRISSSKPVLLKTPALCRIASRRRARRGHDAWAVARSGGNGPCDGHGDVRCSQVQDHSGLDGLEVNPRTRARGGQRKSTLKGFNCVCKFA